MKKLLFMFALMFGMMFASCGNNTGKSEQVDSTKVEVVTIDTTIVDSVQVNSDSISLDSLHV